MRITLVAAVLALTSVSAPPALAQGVGTENIALEEDEDEPTNLRIGSFYTNNANPTVAPLQQGGYTVFPRRPCEIGLQAIYNF